MELVMSSPPPPPPPPPPTQPPSGHQQGIPKKRNKTVKVELFHANFELKSVDGKYKLEIIKIDPEELANRPPEEDKKSRLFGWKVDIRQRANSKQNDKFYRHVQSRKTYRSTTEVIHYILHGDKKDEKAKKPGRIMPRKNNKRKEDEIAESSNSKSPIPTEADDSIRELPQQEDNRSRDALHAKVIRHAMVDEFESSMMMSLESDRNGKGITIQEPEGGLKSKEVLPGNLSVEGKGKGIVTEEENGCLFGNPSRAFGSPPSTFGNFQNHSIIMSMGGNGSSGQPNFGRTLMGLNGNAFEDPSTSLHSNPNVVLADFGNHTQVDPALNGVCATALPGNTIDDPNIIPVLQNAEANREPLRANFVHSLNSTVTISDDNAKNLLNMDSGLPFEIMPTEVQMDEFMRIIYTDSEEENKKDEEKGEDVEVVHNSESDLEQTYDNIMNDKPIVDSFYERYWRDN